MILVQIDQQYKICTSGAFICLCDPLLISYRNFPGAVNKLLWNKPISITPYWVTLLG